MANTSNHVCKHGVRFPQECTDCEVEWENAYAEWDDDVNGAARREFYSQ
jgi:hypothetical protein